MIRTLPHNLHWAQKSGEWRTVRRNAMHAARVTMVAEARAISVRTARQANRNAIRCLKWARGI